MINTFIFINNCRVSFPHLFDRPVINGVEGKYGANLLLDPEKHTKTISQLNEEIAELIKVELKGQRLPPEKYCLRKGEDKRAEYEGFMALSANSNHKPRVVNNDATGQILDAESCSIYSGCRVNAKVKLWAQNNKYGKRINCELVSIQFAGDDEPLGNRVSDADALDGFSAVAINDNTTSQDDGFPF